MSTRTRSPPGRLTCTSLTRHGRRRCCTSGRQKESRRSAPVGLTPTSATAGTRSSRQSCSSKSAGASKAGKPLRHNLFYRRHFKPAVRAALPHHLHGLRFHDLRHTCASLSIAAGAHPKLISARLGHSSIQVTLDRYGHLFPSMEEALATALDAAFAAEAPEVTVTAIGES